MYLLFYLISFCACVVGAICGIGGGIIIKPVLDASGALPVTMINFLSGATVLAMTLYSVMRARIAGDLRVEAKTGTPLAIGSAMGGLLGKELFDMVQGLFPSTDTVGAVQAVVLLAITAGTMVYTLKKAGIATLRISGVPVCLAVGGLLGVMSSFLGIGGGPINLVVLMYLFSMGTKEAAQNSLYIILFSQATSTVRSLMTGGALGIDPLLLVGMIACGILGGVVGRTVNKRLDDARVDKLFVGLMVVIMLICVYNAARYTVL